MIIALIVATAENHVIGHDNRLIWHLPADLKFFKSTTMGCPVIMGRKTFQSIGRVLPGRKNVIITRDSSFNADKAFDITVVNSVGAALAETSGSEKVFIIGGSDIYRQTLHQAHEVYRTLVHHTFDGDAVFPELDPGEFRLTWEEAHPADEKNQYAYTFQKYERIV